MDFGQILKSPCGQESFGMWATMLTPGIRILVPGSKVRQFCYSTTTRNPSTGLQYCTTYDRVNKLRSKRPQNFLILSLIVVLKRNLPVIAQLSLTPLMNCFSLMKGGTVYTVVFCLLVGWSAKIFCISTQIGNEMFISTW
jgi:hypothetical protein